VNRDTSLRTAVSGMLMLAVAMGIGRFAFTPLLPMMQKDAGLSLTLGGWLAAANYLGYFLGALSAAHIHTRHSRVVILALLATAALTAAMALTRVPAVWLLMRCAAGVMSAWVLIFASTWALQAFTAVNRPRLSGVVFSGVGLGVLLAGLLCVLFLYWQWSSAQAWLALGLAALLLGGAALWGFRGADAPAAASAADDSPRRPAVLWLAAAYGLLGFGYIIPATFLPAMARHLLGDSLLFGWTWPVFGLAALVSTLVAGWLSRHFSNRGIWGASNLIMGFGTAVPVCLPDLTGVVLAALCVGGTYMVVTLTGIQEARSLSPQAPSRLIARFTAAFAIGQMAGPVCVSLFPAAFDQLLSLSALLLAASGTGLMYFRKRGAA
jgi:MFS family permease